MSQRTTATLCGCGAAVQDGYLCRVCTRELHDDLVDLAPGQQTLPSYALGAAGRGTTTRWDTPSAVMVGGLGEQLTVTASRQARIGNADGGAEKPVPFNPRAAELRAQLTNTLQPWALWLHGLEEPPAVFSCEHRDPIGVDCPPCAAAITRRQQWARQLAQLSRADVGALAGYLAKRVDTLRQNEAATELPGHLADAVARVRDIIDRQPELVAVGQCGAELADEYTCQQQLYAEPEQTFITCPACDTTWTIADRRAWLLAGAADELGTAATIADALKRLDEHVTVDRIYQWRHRGKLADHGIPCPAHRVPLWVETGRHVGCPDCGPALYRVGDVLQLLTAGMAKATARQAKTDRTMAEQAPRQRAKRQQELLDRSTVGPTRVQREAG